MQQVISRLLAERVGASEARVIDEISSIAFAEPSEAISVAEKLNALALLSKVPGLMVNRQEISWPGGKPVRLDLDASNARARIETRLGDIARRLPAPSELIDTTLARAVPIAVLAERSKALRSRNDPLYR